ncbi:tRNA1(Val) (adenine(37)-N6)-methyltransferase [Jannaschia sp. W003]|uniref:tRNA1(Val) (adenine(37)-N6)-methyltransferase n=1 Tax=Jannaschia sp. W003 TaxID=2867012 RepID=UPI0021A4DEB9|nr:methyltransferase [Jannaschia sp. W003]UWQ22867.1 methyltransferase [Jannaschia sp. W003]
MTRDALLGGRVLLRQPARGGFRAGSDAVLLAAACPAGPGDTVLDLGCGAGAAMLCVAARVPGAEVHGLERDAEAAAMARANGCDVTEGDVLDMPAALRARSFDHVILNPPYFAARGGLPARDPAREAALREPEGGTLAAWCDAAIRRAGPRGTVTVIARADRLADLLVALAPRLGALAVLPVAAREGREAGRVVVSGQKDRRAPLRLLPPLVIHRGAAHRDGADVYTPAAAAVMRDAAAIRLR